MGKKYSAIFGRKLGRTDRPRLHSRDIGKLQRVSQVMADVTKYIEHIEEEEKRSHPFGVTNVLLNGLNGRKSKTTLDTGRSLTWICVVLFGLGLCGIIIYLSAQAASEAKELQCRHFKICGPIRISGVVSTAQTKEEITLSSNHTTTLNTTNTEDIIRKRSKRFVRRKHLINNLSGVDYV